MLLNSIVNPTVNNVSDILSLDLIRNSCETLGLRNPYDTWKEYLFFLQFNTVLPESRFYSTSVGDARSISLIL